MAEHQTKTRHFMTFLIRGNHEDVKGNPLGYNRTTQRGKHADPRARRYEAWKDYVWASLLKSEPYPPRFDAGKKVIVRCYIEYKNDQRPDPGNVVKGIVDALSDKIHRSSHGAFYEKRLFPNDKCVLERVMDYDYSDNPGVLVIVSNAEHVP